MTITGPRRKIPLPETNPLIAARDAFVRAHPETRERVNGREWGVIDVGKMGPALVLIPGTLGRADIFWQQMQALGAAARILALSYPAAGGIADWAEDVLGLCEAHVVSNPVILGSSLGGYLAQYLTAVHPGRVAGLVAANTLSSVAGLDRLPPYSADLAATPIESLRAGFTGGLEQWAVPGNPYRDLAELLLAEVNGRIPEAELRARLQALKSAPELPRQTLPRTQVFTVESGDDHLIAPPIRAALRAALSPGRAFCFETASHFPYVTRPDAYTAMLREVLGLDRPGAVWPAGAEATL